MTFMLSSIKGKERAEVLFDDGDIMLLFNYRWHLARRTKRCLYAAGRTEKDQSIYMHQLILPAPKGLVVDHINGNGLDNRRCNLRLATIALNLRNTPPLNGRKYKGVSLDPRPLRKRWVANLNRGNGKSHLGRFETEIEAAKAYNEAAKAHFGDFAWLNPINEKGNQ